MHGCALVLDLRGVSNILGLRLSPLAVVLKHMFRIIHDLTFARAGRRPSINGDINFSTAPRGDLGHVLRDVLLRVLFLRQTRGPRTGVGLCCVDVTDAFGHVLVDPAGAPVLGYAMGSHVVADLRFQFDWRNGRGFYRLMAAALEHAHTTLRLETQSCPYKG